MLEREKWPSDEQAAATQTLLDQRLFRMLEEAGSSPLGMPGTVDTFKAMLERAGLALVLNGGRR